MHKIIPVVLWGFFTLWGSLSLAQSTDSWPSKPIRIVVGYAPGGGTDIAARLFADALGKQLGQSVIVENRPGATGRIGTAHVAQAAPDGYTFLFGTAAELTIAPVTVKAMTYDPTRDLEPVSHVGWLPNVLVASTKFPPNSLQELIAYVREHPGKVNYGSGGHYSQPHLIGLQFNLAVGTDAVHVPYKGSGPMIADLTAGLVQYSFSSPQPMVDMISTGRLKAIAVLSEERLPNMPSVPTMKEAGLPDFVERNWLALMAPAGTSRVIVEKLNTATVSALKTPTLLQAYQRMYILPWGSTQDETNTFLSGEVAKYKKLAKTIGLQPE